MKIKQKNLISIFFVILLCLIFTFPIIFKMSSHIYGSLYGTDIEGGLYPFWYFDYAISHDINPDNVVMSNHPFGYKMSSIPDNLWINIVRLTTIVTNDIFAFNAFILLSFILSGIFSFYLVLELTKSRLAALFAAIIYTFCPYHFNKAWEHMGLVSVQWFPLYFWMLLRLYFIRNKKYVLLTGFSLFLIISFDFYYAYFAFLTTFGILIFLLINDFFVKKQERKKYLIKNLHFALLVSVACIFSLVLFSPFLVPLIKKLFFMPKTGLNEDMFIRPLSDLFFQSARPLSYLLPSTANPVIGKITEIFKGTIFYGRATIEHTLYVGWTSIILLIFFFRNIKRKMLIFESEEDKFYIRFFTFILIFSFLFSMPPYFNFGIFKLYMPSFFMYKLLPMFRAYARIGIIVMLAVSVLAGFALKYLLNRFKTRVKRVLLASIFIGFSLFEFNNIPPFHITDISKAPAVYEWLGVQEGDFVIAEYPMSSYLEHQDYGFNQRYHLKKMVNGAIPGSPGWDLKKQIIKITDHKTAGILKYIGVKYVIMHLDRYVRGEDKEAVDIIGEVPNLKENKGFKLVKSFDNIDIFEVTAKPIKIDIVKENND